MDPVGLAWNVPEWLQFPLTVRAPAGAVNVPFAPITTLAKSEPAGGWKVPSATLRVPVTWGAWVVVKETAAVALVLAMLRSLKWVGCVPPIVWAAAPSKITVLVPVPVVNVPSLFQFPFTCMSPEGAESVPVEAIVT